MKRTTQNAIDHPEDIQDLDALIVDKRSGKRATSAKGRRRNRRYENRLLNAQTLDELVTDGDAIEPIDPMSVKWNRPSIPPN
jgi:hypothetical protein